MWRGRPMAERGREIDAGEYPALLPWLEQTLVGVSIEPVEDGFVTHWDVIVHNGQRGEGREEAVLATCENEQEAELLAVGLWALLKVQRVMWITREVR